ncbi:MAG: single-stranded-DNA-specific exonuclease RecJ [Lutibacter sp.]
MHWEIQPSPNPQQVQHLAESLQIDSILAGLLIQRGVTNFEEAKAFFRPNLENLHNPFLMKDMEKAVSRIEQAIANGENILVYGDYDVDGTTSVSLISSYLSSFYANIATYIPDRYSEGYGISFKGIDFAEDNNITLIIALDCGIKAINKVAYAKEKKIDFIICDHHRPGNQVPDAVAVLDPKQEDCNYPFKELCGCGVGFKLIQALAANRNQHIEDLISYLDLVAIATAADIVPIIGENRILTYFGLKQLNNNPRNGIKAMLQQFKKKELNISDVVFKIAPRINAAGRIKHGNDAVALLTENNIENAIEFARSIEQHNIYRKELDQKITIEAIQQINDLKEENNCATVVYQENWHKGVIGIVASRLIETYYRPTLVFTKSNNKLTASARSVKGFDIYNALEKCSDLIEQFGGHKYAAGLTIKEENYQKFKNNFNEVVSSLLLESSKVRTLKIDAELNLSSITPKFYRILKQFAPFGPGNMKPVFVTTNLRDNGFGKPIGENNDHLRLQLFEGTQQQNINAIGFNMGEIFNKTQNKAFSAAYCIEENHWNGYTSLQLHLKDINFDML